MILSNHFGSGRAAERLDTTGDRLSRSENFLTEILALAGML